jgi:hypothetical protein
MDVNVAQVEELIPENHWVDISNCEKWGGKYIILDVKHRAKALSKNALSKYYVAKLMSLPYFP